MSKVDSNPKVLKKQITCVNNNYQNESITEKNTNNDGIGFNRANSLSSENTNSILHKNASESSKLASFDGGSFIFFVNLIKFYKMHLNK